MGDVTVIHTSGDALRDQYGRYLLPDPDTWAQTAWTRVTTVANTLSDRFALEQWGNRNVVLGIAARQDLYALAASAEPDDKALLHQIIEDAQEAAGAMAGANLGKALHKILERVDAGDDLHVPDEWRADVDAYCQTLADSHVRIHPEFMERIVVIPKAKIAGTLDRLVSYDDELYVADIKTGKDVVNYGMGDIAIQLALYAHSTLMWNGNDYDPMPEVNRERALVIHVPVSQGKCHLHWVDIQAGREAALLALSVREWRKRKDLSQPFELADPKVMFGGGA